MLVVAAVNIPSITSIPRTERKNACSGSARPLREREAAEVVPRPLYDGNIEQLDSTLDSFFSNPDMVGSNCRSTTGHIRLPDAPRRTAREQIFQPAWSSPEDGRTGRDYHHLLNGQHRAVAAILPRPAHPFSGSWSWASPASSCRGQALTAPLSA